MKFLALPTSLLLSITLQARSSAAQLENDFSAYPEGSQECITDAANQTQCSGSTGQELNQCLCRNKGNFIYNTAMCVANESPGDLNAVYDTMQNNCQGTGVTIAVSKEAFLSQAAAATSSPGSPTSTSSPEATQSLSPVAQSSISTGAKIGLGAGIGIGTVGLGLLAWFIWLYSKRRRSQTPPPPSANGTNHDVELSNSNMPGNQSFVSSMASPHVAYAHHNTQFAAAELGDTHQEWKELPADNYDHVKADDGSHKRTSDVPLLAAELGHEETRGNTPVSPIPTYAVELPAEVVYPPRSPPTPTVSPMSYSPYHEHGYTHHHGTG
ncbi:uncharacterized protein GGS22DRAFT_186219 [Annulohypoxylon maeteangense]|uniref:uncharacterized protein n=1 Tax=Annulohypoxylon maeteangense TaxID=1927788 RepID=UPI0020084F33|nr:uncharacterized protein GGS22DRAFT_186219 [Annulohypoxylon maeteangense]KAI0887390.1 hypothetical protein GGS22DRAFT_186219 [Annulohypoxylon maeteangense]